MLQLFSRYWWAFVLRGLLAVLFGLFSLFCWWVMAIFGLFVFFFSPFVFLEGLLSVIAASYNRGAKYWYVVLLEGVVAVLVGILTFVWLGIPEVVLFVFIAAWVLVTGIFKLIASIQLRKQIEGELLLGLSGLVSIFFGLILLIRINAGAPNLVWLIGVYAIIFGILTILLGFKVRKTPGPSIAESRK
jgi:uncharacterized membrane protein HdeD (DUF308 family)